MQKCVYLHIRMKTYDSVCDHTRALPSRTQFRILSQKRETSALQEYIIMTIKGLWTDRKNLLKVEKVDYNNSHPNDIGKYKIKFQDGADLIHSNVVEHIPDFMWPTYPTVLDTEKEANLFKECWTEYIDTQVRMLKP